MPEWLKGADCKSVDGVYDGSNPSLPTTFYDPLAQLVEHLTFNQGVGRSSRPWVTILESHKPLSLAVFLVFCINYNLYVIIRLRK